MRHLDIAFTPQLDSNNIWEYTKKVDEFIQIPDDDGTRFEAFAKSFEHELLNSSVSVFNDRESKERKKVMDVYNDTSNTFMPSGHPSWADNSNQNVNIPMWMNDGTNSPLYSHLQTNYIDIAHQKIESGIKEEFIIALKKYGLEAY